jgi:hypothetical protein
MAKAMSLTIVTVFMVLASQSPGMSGSCYEVGGMVRCTEDVGRNPTLQSIDKAMGTPAPYIPPTSYPEALKSYPSDIKSSDSKGKDPRSEVYTDDGTPKPTLEPAGLTKGKR